MRSAVADEFCQKARRFRALHQAPPILVIPNAWDASSARIYEVEGCPAIATTSAGIAATLGYPDGQRMSLDQNLAVVRTIAASVAVPVSADVEAGYADDPRGVAEAARAALLAGAVGVNLEDGTGDPARPLVEPGLMVERLEAVQEMAASEGIPLFVNARIDTFLVHGADPTRRLEETVARARAYERAGADGIFVPSTPGGLDRAAIAELVRETTAPLNLIAGAGLPSVHELTSLGVARLSFGPRLMRAALAFLRRMVREWTEQGSYELMIRDTLSSEEVQALSRPGSSANRLS